MIHELWHGLVSKHYGGQVYEAGVLLVLFLPIGYVDATPSWRFPGRWQRIHTAAAGMIAELSVAAVAAFVWAELPPGPAADLAFNLVLIAAVDTLIFNANPLMRFDGYFILADLTGIPNLYQRGQEFTRHLGRRYLLGIRSAWSPGLGALKGLFVRVYGLAALAWRIAILVVILVVASGLFHGLGLVVSVLAGAALLAVPLLRLVRAVRGGSGQGQPGQGEPASGDVRASPLRYLPRLALISALVLGFGQIEWSPSLSAPAVVEFHRLSHGACQHPRLRERGPRPAGAGGGGR